MASSSPWRSGSRAAVVPAGGTQRGTLGDQRLGELEPRARPRRELRRLAENLRVALDGAEDAQGPRHHRRGAPDTRQLELLRGRRARLLATAEVVERERLMRARRRVDGVHAGEALRGLAGNGQCLLEPLLGEELLGVAVEPVARGLRDVTGLAHRLQLAPRGHEVPALALHRGQPGRDLRAAVGRAAEDELLDPVAQRRLGVGELALAQQSVAAAHAGRRLVVQRPARVRLVDHRRPHVTRLLAVGQHDHDRRHDRGDQVAALDEVATLQRGQRERRALVRRAAAVRPLVRRDRREQLRPGARRERQPPIGGQAFGRDRVGAEEGSGRLDRLERGQQDIGVRWELARHAAGERDRLVGAVVDQQPVGQVQRGPGPQDGILGQLERFAQVRLALPRGPRAGERQQDVRPALGHRRLGERARQVRRGARRRARTLGGSCRLLEHVDDPRLSAGRRVHELRGHRSRAGAATVQQACGAFVGERAFVCGHVLVDGRADERMRERRRRLVGEHLGADQLVGGDHGGGVVQAGELGDERERRGIAEHGGRVRHGRRVPAQAAEPYEHGA